MQRQQRAEGAAALAPVAAVPPRPSRAPHGRATSPVGAAVRAAVREPVARLA